ncbi:hypothetical protein J6Q66_02205 [bacterium]|nr:hypothetical protein [bacterium]
MITNLVNFFSNAIVNQTQSTKMISNVQSTSGNPFANPFLENSSANYSRNFYGKNNPLKGGYFAGYYNGQPNIVGRRLFIEV